MVENAGSWVRDAEHRVRGQWKMRGGGKRGVSGKRGVGKRGVGKRGVGGKCRVFQNAGSVENVGSVGKCGEYNHRIQARPPSAQPCSLNISFPASPPPPRQEKCPGNEVDLLIT